MPARGTPYHRAVNALGRYRLEEQVGQGGMAVVWRALDTQLMRTVAVKVLHAHLIAREEIRRRFQREAKAVARLHHHHILDIYDVSSAGEPPGGPSYLVTEFIPGWSLRNFADKHPFDPPELAAAVALALADALEHAHAAGVVHRDLKPENVMLREDGVVKLTDFGIATLLDPDDKFTATGAILGSPAHLPPEIIEGKPADPRSDLFSLGTLLYWLACGQLPFQARTPAALLKQILDVKPPDPRTHRASIGDGLAALIMRLLEKDPALRVQTAAEAKRELARLLAEAGIDAPETELKAFVSGEPPEEIAGRLRERLVAHSLDQGGQALRERRTGRALSAYARALALQPGQPEATRRLEQLRNRRRLLRRLRAAAVVAIAGLALWGGLRLAQAWRTKQELSAPPESREMARARPEPRPRPPPIAAPADHAAAAPGAIGSAMVPNGTIDPSTPPEPAPGSASAPIHPRSVAAREPAPELPVTLSVHWVWAHVLVDGRELGEKQNFTTRLSIGPHRVLVSHACCLDNEQTIDVEPGQSRYALEPGRPKPARLSIQNAPADAMAVVDGVSMGTPQNLARLDLPMLEGPSREVLLTVGARSGRVMLRAGQENRVEWNSLGGAP